MRMTSRSQRSMLSMLKSILVTSTSTILILYSIYIYILLLQPSVLRVLQSKRRDDIRRHFCFFYIFFYFILFYFILSILYLLHISTFHIFLSYFYTLKLCALLLLHFYILCNYISINPNAMVIFSHFRDNYFIFSTLIYIFNLSLSLL